MRDAMLQFQKTPAFRAILARYESGAVFASEASLCED